MGWDAFAWNGGIVDPLPKEAAVWFAKAAQDVIDKVGSVDCGVKTGMLDCRACADAIKKLTNLNPYSERPVDPSEFKLNLDDPRWEESWASYSAFKFLEGCLKFNYSVHFSD